MKMTGNNVGVEASRKWFWMADYCRKMGWNPCDSYFWNNAEQAYTKEKLNETICV